MEFKASILAPALAVMVGAGLLLARCSHPSPHSFAVNEMPHVKTQAISSSSAAVVATQSMRVTIRRGGLFPHSSAQTSPLETETKQLRGGKVDQFSQSPNSAAQDEEIVIEMSQAIASSARSNAAASVSVPVVYKLPTTDHGRVGVILSTMPGVVALDVEILRADLPPWLAGVPMEVGLDLAGNLEAGAVGVSAGGKAFAIAGAWIQWDGRAQGVLAGVGMRF